MSKPKKNNKLEININSDDEKDIKSDNGKEVNDLQNINPDGKPKSGIRKTKTVKATTKNNKKGHNKKKPPKKPPKDPNKPTKHVKFIDKIDIVKIECWKKYNLEQTADENLDELFEENDTKDKSSSQNKKNENRNNNNNSNNSAKNKKGKSSNITCTCIIV